MFEFEVSIEIGRGRVGKRVIGRNKVRNVKTESSY